jgi:SAM-dependent methyltransferase
MLKHGSDKGGNSNSNHNYTTVYEPLLFRYKSLGSSVNFFELGLGTINRNLNSSMWWVPGYRPGASHRAWAEWLPEANIFGADIDPDTLFEDGNITKFQVDQTSPSSISDMWSKIDKKFDVIIDDGLHEFEANHNFLLNSHHKLKDGGVYIIEDILNGNCQKFTDKFPEYMKFFKSASLIPLAWERNKLDNNLLVLCK